MKLIQASLLFGLGIFIAGCESKDPDAAPPAIPERPTSQPSQPNVPTAPPPTAQHAEPQLPALYAGVLPCADCDGIRYELDLRADSVFFLRTTYLGKAPDAAIDDAGQWVISSEDVLALRGRDETPLLFSIMDAQTLRKLDLNGTPIESPLNYQITLQSPYAPLEPQLAMRGMYQYMADAATFEECTTGLKLAVATEGDNAALESGYAKARREPGQAVLADLEGRLVRRPGMEGDQLRDTLIVEKMGKFWPNESCGARGVTHELEGTRWVLVRLGEEVVEPADAQREPYIALESIEHRVSGHGGCNRLLGAYELDGDRLTFKQMALTRMACPDMKYEGPFAAALEVAQNWKIAGAHLELFDVNGTSVARFEAKNL